MEPVNDMVIAKILNVKYGFEIAYQNNEYYPRNDKLKSEEAYFSAGKFIQLLKK